MIEGVHRVTVLRRLTRALDDLGQRIAALLHERIGLAPTELSELVHAIRSQLELSISALRSPSSAP